MKHERLMGIAGFLMRPRIVEFIMRPPLLALCLCATAALAYGVHWHQTNVRRYGRAPFSLVGHPATRTILAGGIARYVIAIHRLRYPGRIRLSLGTVGPGLLTDWGRSVGNRATVRLWGRTAVVTVRTSRADAPGRYRVHVRAAGGRYRGVLTLGLKILRPREAPFTVSGRFGSLWPGASRTVDLALTNPSPRAIAISRLTVSVQHVSAPRATAELPCSAADFSVSQFSGGYPLNLLAHASVRLSDLGIAAHGPRLQMLDRPVNQDGCQGATVTLAYSGIATSP